METGAQPPEGPQSPAQQPPAPGYSGPVPPGGWQQPVQPAYAPGSFKLASWWSRVGATVLDGLIITVPALLFAGILGIGAFASRDGTGTAAFIGGIVLTILIAAVVALVYAPLLMARGGRANGQTLGKQVVNCRVIRTDGQAFTFGSAAVREIAIKWLLFGVVGGFFASIPTLVDYLWPLWDDENRALHDFLANTRVVEA